MRRVGWRRCARPASAAGPGAAARSASSPTVTSTMRQSIRRWGSCARLRRGLLRPRGKCWSGRAERETEGVTSSHGRFVWYELVTTDVKAAMAFYSKVMGWGAWDASAPGKAYILFGDGKGSISGLVQLPDDDKQMGGKPSWVGYVAVDDVDATAARLARLGRRGAAPRPAAPRAA